MNHPNFTVRARRIDGDWVEISRHRCPKPAARSLAKLIRALMRGETGEDYRMMVVLDLRADIVYPLVSFRAAMDAGMFDGPEYR